MLRRGAGVRALRKPVPAPSIIPGFARYASTEMLAEPNPLQMAQWRNTETRHTWQVLLVCANLRVQFPPGPLKHIYYITIVKIRQYLQEGGAK